MVSVGIITYHAAYNFGSVLQALGTQIAFQKYADSVSIINYRPKGQRDYYEPLYRTSYTMKVFLNDLVLLPVQRARLLRAKRFEHFIGETLNLTECYPNSANLYELANSFDVFVSGSDQILNIHSNEYRGDDWDSMAPYLLRFTEGRKVSYASSPANMTREELDHIIPDLSRFYMVSARERDAAKALGDMLGKPVNNVLDPTLLISGDEWRSIASRYLDKVKLPKRYAVIYTLERTKPVLRQYKFYCRISETLGMPIVLIAPFAFFPQSNRIIDGRSSGPAEFINLIDHASVVVTNSYHGTLFSMNLNTPFLSISDGKGSSTRKDQVLQRMGLDGAVVSSIEDAADRLDVQGLPSVGHISSPLEEGRRESMHYIAQTLNFESR